jgi:hypothetical protein
MRTPLLVIYLLLVQNIQAQTVPVKRVLLEEFTTARDGHPNASKPINEWHDSHSNSILVTIHDGYFPDAMTAAFMKNYVSAFCEVQNDTIVKSFTPAMMIDRKKQPSKQYPYMSTYGFDTIASRIINEPALVDIQIMNGSYNSATRVLTAAVDVKFTSVVDSGDYRINLFLVEDSVIGTGRTYDQRSYDSIFAVTNYPGMYDGKFILGYPHRHVLRAALLSTWGDSTTIPNTPVIGTTYSKSISYTVPNNYNDKKLSVVATIAHHGASQTSKYVLNAIDHTVSSYFATDIEEKLNPIVITNIYPIPAKENIHLEFGAPANDKIELSIVDILGRNQKVISPTMITNRQEIDIDVKDLSAGIYFLTIKSPTSQSTCRFVIQ